MLFKGTEKRTSKEIAEAFDDIGAHANAFTSKSILVIIQVSG
jgi:predicted Zn-dependent peptidase